MSWLVRPAVGLALVAALAGCSATGATTEPAPAIPSQASVVTLPGSGAGPVANASASPAIAAGQTGSSGLTFSGIAEGPAGWTSPPFDLAADIYDESWVANPVCPSGFTTSLAGPRNGPEFQLQSGFGQTSGGGILGALPGGTYQLSASSPGPNVCPFTITLLGATANGTGNLGPWNVTIVADRQETQPREDETSIAPGFTRHVLTLAVQNVSHAFFPVEIGGVVRSSDGFVYPQSGASAVELPIAPGSQGTFPDIDTALIPPGFRVPVSLSIDVASNAQDPTVSLCLLAAGPFQPACGASRLEAKLASVPSSGSVSFAAPGALPVGSPLAQGPLSFTVSGFTIDCTPISGASVTVRVRSAYGYPLQPGMQLEVFDPAGRLETEFNYAPNPVEGSPVPPGGSRDFRSTSAGGCGAGTYIGVLQLAPLVADAQSTQTLAGAETFVFAMPRPSR